ncbi:MAG: anaerobic ribonucleoside-triphosphate reductase activating protein [Christensenellales bacterium]|jgi:pyruvate formate lyase activating enzyme
MKLAGLQKLTLLDYPGKVACTVFTAGCNYRCPFCHNGDLVLPELMPPALAEADFFAFLQKRRGVLDGVCVSGGEPLIHGDIPAFLERIKALGYAVKLDTNGAFPDKLRALVEAGLVDYVAMDIKNAPDRYAQTVGVDRLDLAPVRESVAYLLSGAVDYEFRTTVVRQLHSAEDLENIGKWLSGAKRYFLQAFVDSEYVLKGGLTSYSKTELEALRERVCALVPSVQLRGV